MHGLGPEMRPPVAAVYIETSGFDRFVFRISEPNTGHAASDKPQKREHGACHAGDVRLEGS